MNLSRNNMPVLMEKGGSTGGGVKQVTSATSSGLQPPLVGKKKLVATGFTPNATGQTAPLEA